MIALLSSVFALQVYLGSDQLLYLAYHGVVSGPVEPLQQVRLLSALRSGMWLHGMANSWMLMRHLLGDPALIHPFLTEIGKERRNSIDGDLNTGAAALHLAIRCASGACCSVAPKASLDPMNSSIAETVQLLLLHRAISPNGIHPPGSGTTALHLAASLGRAEIVSLLLDQPGIDDTLRDNQSRTCKDVAKGKEVVQVLQGRLAHPMFFVLSLIRPRFAILSERVI